MIILKNVSKSYDNTQVLNKIDYEFGDAGITCLLGPSGSGKSTLLNLISGFDTDYSGDIIIFGKSITGGSFNGTFRLRLHRAPSLCLHEESADFTEETGGFAAASDSSRATTSLPGLHCGRETAGDEEEIQSNSFCNNYLQRTALC